MQINATIYSEIELRLRHFSMRSKVCYANNCYHMSSVEHEAQIAKLSVNVALEHKTCVIYFVGNAYKINQEILPRTCAVCI